MSSSHRRSDTAVVSRSTLAEQVTELLVQYIADNELHPGDPLPSEGQLVERFQVSRPVVREALRTLQGQHIIKTSAGKSAVVRQTNAAMLTPYFRHAIQIGKENPADLIDARAPIEIAAARMAATMRTEEDLQALSHTLASMQSSLDDPDRYSELDTTFHILVVRASGNRIMTHIIESMSDALQHVSATGLALRHVPGEFERIQDNHTAVYEAIAAGDPDAAEAAMREHFVEAETFLKGKPAHTND